MALAVAAIPLDLETARRGATRLELGDATTRQVVDFELDLDRIEDEKKVEGESDLVVNAIAVGGKGIGGDVGRPDDLVDLVGDYEEGIGGDVRGGVAILGRLWNGFDLGVALVVPHRTGELL